MMWYEHCCRVKMGKCWRHSSTRIRAAADACLVQEDATSSTKRDGYATFTRQLSLYYFCTIICGPSALGNWGCLTWAEIPSWAFVETMTPMAACKGYGMELTCVSYHNQIHMMDTYDCASKLIGIDNHLVLFCFGIHFFVPRVRFHYK